MVSPGPMTLSELAVIQAVVDALGSWRVGRAVQGRRQNVPPAGPIEAGLMNMLCSGTRDADYQRYRTRMRAIRKENPGDGPCDIAIRLLPAISEDKDFLGVMTAMLTPLSR